MQRLGEEDAVADVWLRGPQPVVPAALLAGSANVKTLTLPTEVPDVCPLGDDPRDRDDNSRDLSRGTAQTHATGSAWTLATCSWNTSTCLVVSNERTSTITATTAACAILKRGR
jgi:hypothetical protein